MRWEPVYLVGFIFTQDQTVLAAERIVPSARAANNGQAIHPAAAKVKVRWFLGNYFGTERLVWHLLEDFQGSKEDVWFVSVGNATRQPRPEAVLAQRKGAILEWLKKLNEDVKQKLEPLINEPRLEEVQVAIPRSV
jgi:hypothetical protein